jgi:HEAT repeat protein
MPTIRRTQALAYLLIFPVIVAQAADPPPPDPALAEAAKALKAGDPEARYKAAAALANAGPKALPFLRPLRVALLDDEEDRVRMVAAQALGLIGPHAAPAVGNLVEMYEDDDEPVGIRSACLEALGRIGSPRAYTWVRRSGSDHTPHT